MPLQTKSPVTIKDRPGRFIFHFPIWEGQLFNFSSSTTMMIKTYSHSQQSQGISFFNISICSVAYLPKSVIQGVQEEVLSPGESTIIADRLPESPRSHPVCGRGVCALRELYAVISLPGSVSPRGWGGGRACGGRRSSSPP